MKLSLYSLLKKRFPYINENELYGYILCGDVYYDGEKLREPARMVDSKKDVEIRQKSYVSRGGFKLAGALDLWDIDCKDKVFLDAGASTGGFTDCLLQRGAAHVHAVDVGYNQLDYSLRIDKRVSVRERCNIMDVSDPQPRPHMAVADLSFRSIRGAASHIVSLTEEKFLIALIKPQFEVEKSADFTGIVSDPAIWHVVLNDVFSALHDEGLGVTNLSAADITGKKGGNQEFLALIRGGMKSSDKGLIDRCLRGLTENSPG